MATTHSAVENIRLRRIIEKLNMKEVLKESLENFEFELDQEQMNNVMRMLIKKNSISKYV